MFLHGWGLGAPVFETFVPALSGQFAVVRSDLPGYGGTACVEPYTLERIAATVAARVDGACHVVGWSLGAQVALTWALACPEQVQSLTLIGATPCFASRPDWDAAMPLPLLGAFRTRLRDDPAATLQRFALLQTRGDAAAKEVNRSLRGVLARQAAPAPAALDAGLQILEECDLRPWLCKVGQPCQIVHGEQDALVPLAAARFLAATLPRSRLATIPDAGHAPFVSRSAQVAALVAEHSQ